MTTARYLEVDSTYRNRNEWPLPAEFEMLISQTGRKNRSDAVDPVSLASSSFRWQSYAFNTTGPSATVSGTVENIDSPGFGASGDTNTLITLTAIAGNTFQQLSNYYIASVMFDFTTGQRAGRIVSYRYLGTNAGGLDRVQFILNSAIAGIQIGDQININDPTDLGNAAAPLIFVPNGLTGENSYATNYIYNETLSIATIIPQYRPISGCDAQTNVLYINTTSSVIATNSSGPVTGWTTSDVFTIRKEIPILGRLNNNITSATIFSLYPDTNSELDIYRNSYIHMLTGAGIVLPATGDTRLITRYETFTGIAVTGTIITVVFPNNASDRNGYYNGAYIQILSGLATGDIRQVVSYTVTGVSPNLVRTAIVDANFTGVIATGDSFTFRSGFVSEAFSPVVSNGDIYELLQFSYDNLFPFVYSGSLVSQQEMVCYEIELLSVSLPNIILATGAGSRIAFYPYIYVEIANVSGSSAGMINTIYSNNPNATRMVFHAAIDNINNPLIAAFVKISGAGMTQTLKFKPNDNLRFSVHLANGELYETVLKDNVGPLAPNPLVQISALFSITRL